MNAFAHARESDTELYPVSAKLLHHMLRHSAAMVEDFHRDLLGIRLYLDFRGLCLRMPMNVGKALL